MIRYSANQLNTVAKLVFDTNKQLLEFHKIQSPIQIRKMIIDHIRGLDNNSDCMYSSCGGWTITIYRDDINTEEKFVEISYTPIEYDYSSVIGAKIDSKGNLVVEQDCNPPPLDAA